MGEHEVHFLGIENCLYGTSLHMEPDSRTCRESIPLVSFAIGQGAICMEEGWCLHIIVATGPQMSSDCGQIGAAPARYGSGKHGPLSHMCTDN